MKITVAYSPCPNDTFMFHALATEKIQLPGHEIEVCLHDVETLNRRSLEHAYDFTKLSVHAYLQVRGDYILLRTGAALGFGCGPLVVAKRRIEHADLADMRIAIPGEMTTAHLLFRLWAPAARERVFVPYDRIPDMVAQGEVDCGVIIHESRFVYEQAGLRALADLGEWWEEETRLPIPLGCIAAKRGLPGQVVADFEAALRESIEHARENPEAAFEYAKQFAQELDDEVLSKHVETFVNESSLDIDDDGMAAIRKLEEMAEAAGIMA